MRDRIVGWIRLNRTTIILTFEIFYLFVFIFDRVSSNNSVEIPQFIYVNF